MQKSTAGKFHRAHSLEGRNGQRDVQLGALTATQMQVNFQSARPPTGTSAAAKKWDFGTSRLAALFNARAR
jgi:hypothetical protein